MQENAKRIVIASMAIAVLVAVFAILDLTMGFPFSGKHTMVMDILFILCAGIVGYMSWDTFRDMK